jgi:hypothetical protein
MKTKEIIIFSLFLIFSHISFSQQYVIFTISQPEQLQAHAGMDMYIPVGNSGVIGGTPAASGGSPSYTYLWTPGIYLNDSAMANPQVNPLTSVDYILTVTDMNNCTAFDTVRVDVDSSNITIGQRNNYNESPLVFYSSDNNIIHIFCDESTYANEEFSIVINDLLGRTILKQQAYINGSFDINLSGQVIPQFIIINLSVKEINWTFKIFTK